MPRYSLPFILLLLSICAIPAFAPAQNPPPPGEPAELGRPEEDAPAAPAKPIAPTAVKPAAAKPAAAKAAAEKAAPDPNAPINLPFIKPVPITVILTEIESQTGIKVAPLGESSKAAAALAGDNMTIEETLTRLCQPNNLVWRKTADGYKIYDEKYYKEKIVPTLTQQKVFIPVHISGEYLFEAIKQSNILTKDVGNITLDKRTNQVVVIDLPEKLALVQDMVNLLDVPQYTRVFYIRYADVEEVAQKIEQFKSEPGTIETDPMAHLIVVRDVLANIQRMESLIEVLDTRQPRRVYNLNSIGIEEDEIKALEENLKLLLTKDAYFSIDPLRGQLIIEDTPEVHDEIEKYLRIFDKPVRQVLIQAELLDVKQDNTFAYGTEASFSGDLIHAVEDGLFGNSFLPKSSVSYPTGTPFGFFDYKKEYPLGTSGSGGLSVTFLSSNVKAQLTAALSDTNTRTLLKPRLLVKNREKATIVSGADNPIVNQTNNYNNNTNNNTYSQQYVTSGLTVEIEPTISATDLIELSLKIENSDADTVALQAGVDSNGNPVSLTGVKKVRDEVNTVLIIPNGETRVISGLLRRYENDQVKGVPFLCNIPWIGPLLFGSQDKSDNTRNLLFFITPSIVEERGAGDLIAADFDDFKRPARAQSVTDILGTGRASESTRREAAAAADAPAAERRFDAPLPGETTRQPLAATADQATTTSQAAPDNSESGLKRFLLEGGATPNVEQAPAGPPAGAVK